MVDAELDHVSPGILHERLPQRCWRVLEFEHLDSMAAEVVEEGIEVAVDSHGEVWIVGAQRGVGPAGVAAGGEMQGEAPDLEPGAGEAEIRPLDPIETDQVAVERDAGGDVSDADAGMIHAKAESVHDVSMRHPPMTCLTGRAQDGRERVRGVRGEGRRAAVIGGSLGGLTAANLLRDHGWDVTVYERSPVPLDGRGAGIVVHPSTVRYLLEHLGTDLDDISCPSSTLRYFAVDGSVEFEEPSTYRFTAWNTLYQQLLGGIGGRHRLGHALCGLDMADDGVELRFANGLVEHAELVVGADGFDSTVRRRLFPSVNSSYSGYVGWRGLVSERELSPTTFGLLADAISYCVIPDSHIVAYPIPTTEGSTEIGQRLVNYVWYRNVAAGAELDELMTGKDGLVRTVSLHPGVVQDRFVEEMKAAAEALAPPLAEIVQRTPEPFLQVIVDIESDRMALGRVAMLGDGAFAARPHAAAGTAKAAQDGWELVAALDAHDTVPAALAAWEVGQLELGRQLVARARDLGERSQFRGTWIPGDPELAFGLYGPGH